MIHLLGLERLQGQVSFHRAFARLQGFDSCLSKQVTTISRSHALGHLYKVIICKSQLQEFLILHEKRRESWMNPQGTYMMVVKTAQGGTRVTNTEDGAEGT